MPSFVADPIIFVRFPPSDLTRILFVFDHSASKFFMFVHFLRMRPFLSSDVSSEVQTFFLSTYNFHSFRVLFFYSFCKFDCMAVKDSVFDGCLVCCTLWFLTCKGRSQPLLWPLFPPRYFAVLRSTTVRFIFMRCSAAQTSTGGLPS